MKHPTTGNPQSARPERRSAAVAHILAQGFTWARRTCIRVILPAVLILVALLVYLLNDTDIGRLYQFALGIVAFFLFILAAALWARSIKRISKMLPIAWLPKHHVMLGILFVFFSGCHIGARWPASLWSWGLVSVSTLVICSGLASWFVKDKLYDTAKFVENKLKRKPDASGATTALSPREQTVLEGSAIIVETPDKALEIHRAVTLAMLVYLVGHIVHHICS
jgi:hypothetical protein